MKGQVGGGKCAERALRHLTEDRWRKASKGAWGEEAREGENAKSWGPRESRRALLRNALERQSEDKA